MIRINLLPPERRKPERTPLPRFMLILIGAGLATGIITYLVFLGIKITNEQSHGDQLAKTLGDIKKATIDYKDVKAEEDGLNARKKAIEGLAKRPIYWSEIIDNLWSVINAQESMWVTEITVLGEKKVSSIAKNLIAASGNKKAAGPPYGVRLKMNMYGDDVRMITKLRMALFDNLILKQYLPIMNRDPVYVRSSTPDGPTVTTFEITLIAQPPAAPVKGK